MHANRLRQRAVGKYGNAIYVAARQRAYFKLQLQRHLVVGMQRRRSLYFQAQVHIFGAGVGSLPRAAATRRQCRGVLNDGYDSLAGSGTLRDQRHVGKSAGGQGRNDQRPGRGGGVQLHRVLK